MRLTTKQIEILKLIKGGNLDGSHLDITQLRLALSYTATKQAVLCSVKYLVARDLVARVGRVVRSGRTYTTLKLTTQGEAFIAPYIVSLKSALIETEVDLDD